MILAGGAGTRLAPPALKPLTKLLGLTLLERVAWTAWLGFKPEKIIIVGGYKFEKLQKTIPHLHLPPANIQVIKNPLWEKGNGTSILAAQPFLQGNTFIVCMVDHILPEQIYSSIATLQTEHCTVAVDTNPPPYIDLDDASKVWFETSDNSQAYRVKKIGKNLPQWNGIDMGVFRLSRTIFPYLKQELSEKGECSILGTVQRMIDSNEIFLAFPVTGIDWVDIDTPQMLETAKKIILNNLHKPTDGPVSRLINRHISTRISALIASTSITPNQISLFAFLLSILAAALMVIPNYWTLLLGGLLAQISSIIDGCDGEIARLKFKTSELGGWLDAVMDRYSDAMLVSALALHAYLAGLENPLNVIIWLTIGLSGVLLNSYTADKYDAFIKRILKHKSSRSVVLRIGRDVRIFIIFLGTLLNLPLYTLAITGILNHIEVLRRIYVLLRSSGK